MPRTMQKGLRPRRSPRFLPLIRMTITDMPASKIQAAPEPGTPLVAIRKRDAVFVPFGVVASTDNNARAAVGKELRARRVFSEDDFAIAKTIDGQFAVFVKPISVSARQQLEFIYF